MKKIAIHQPQYFPWLGLIHKISQCDTFVFLDNVQFNKRSFQNRALYSTNNGAKYLTIPVSAKNHQINNIQIKDIQNAEPMEMILNKHYKTLKYRYGKTRGWELQQEKIDKFFNRNYTSVCELIIESMNFTLDLFGIQTDCIKASDLNSTGYKDELILNITKELNGDIYLSGQGAKSYMREEIFNDSCIGIVYQEFFHPTYSQSHGGNFVEGCMAIDFYFESPEDALKYAEDYLWSK